jgi:phosphatidate cytidylyltransferase
VTRVLSALVLLPLVIGTIWFLPPWATLALATLAALLAFLEFARIVHLSEARMHAASAAAVIGGCLAVALGRVELVMMSVLIVAGAAAVAIGRPGPDVFPQVAAAIAAPVYLGLPLGALAAVRASAGREAVVLLLVVIVVSDSAQYYTGRAFGRHPLSPEISPKKTTEGAIGGVLFGTLALTVGGFYVFQAPLWLLILVGAAISLLGIVGDLFESLLKRSAGVKDSSNLIPGHGGVLDRIDSWLFAAPVYYVFVRFVTS